LALQTTPLENDPARVLHFDFNRFQNLVNHFSRAAFYNSRNLCYNARRGVENVHSLFRSRNVNAKRRTVKVGAQFLRVHGAPRRELGNHTFARTRAAFLFSKMKDEKNPKFIFHPSSLILWRLQ
jgi:hypothetical protein